MKTFSALQEELQKARDGLKSVDSHIKRIIGRDPDASPQTPRPNQLKRPINQNDDFYARGRGSFQMGGGRGRGGPPGRQQEDDGPPGIRRRLGERPGTVFSRLSGLPPRYNRKEKESDDFSGPPAKYIKKEEEDEEIDDEDAAFKPAISSRVIPQTRELPSKEDIIAAQADARSVARNRRMFGALVGTLQRFRQEESKLRDREDKRAVIEKKVEEAAKREKEEMKKEKQELFLDRRKKQQEIRRIEFKITRVKEQDQWEARHRPLLNFIQTKTKPSIFYLPKIQNTKTEERLVASQKIIAKMMEKKRATVQEELDRLEGSVQVKTEASADHHSEEEGDNMDAENDTAETTEGLQNDTGDSPVENKENRLRSINVKVEKDEETQAKISGKIVRPDPEDKKDDADRHSRDHARQPSHQRERRDQHDVGEQRDLDRAKDRQRHDRDRMKDKERDRGRERERNRDRDRKNEKDGERDITSTERKEEEKWDRKWDRRNSTDTNAMEEEEETIEDRNDHNTGDAPELSSISLPGEQSSPAQPSADEQDEGIIE